MQETKEVPCKRLVIRCSQRENNENLFKAYSYDGDQYIGLVKDNFGGKLMYFLKRRYQADIDEDDRNRKV